MSKNNSFLNFSFDFTDQDLNQLFEPFDPMFDSGSKELGHLNKKISTPFDPMDLTYLKSMLGYFLDNIVDSYFRAEIIGIEKLVKDGPAIFGCNHSGTAFPHDGLVLDALIWRHYKFMPKYKCRSVYSPKLAQVWWMRPYGIDNFWRRGGGVDITFQNFSALLGDGERVIYYPEGVPGIGKGFTRRYQLQHFYSSFAVLAAMHNAPFCPILCVNAEWVNPTSFTVKWLDSLFDKLLGLPFFPIPAIFVGMIFPFFYFLAFPCKMKFLVGDPINVRDLLKQNGVSDYTKADKLDFQKVADQIRQSMQTQLSAAVLEHGKEPYEIKSFWKKMKELGSGWIKATPFGWPFSYIKNERDLFRPKAGAFWSFIRDWDIWLFFVPFGWLFLSLSRALRKAPYGYRGLSKEEYRTKTGSYYWNLKENPLPSRKERFD